MGVTTTLHDLVLTWSRDRRAPWYLAGLSFAESSFFPIPPDVMLAPMSIASPGRAWRLAALTTLMSVVGGLAGYALGVLLLGLLQPLIGAGGPAQLAFVQATDWFGQWGVWAVLLAAFSPIPYKVFTIAAGMLSMALPPFIVASTLGRGGRYFLVVALMVWGGERMRATLHSYMDHVGWIMLLLAAAVVVWSG